MNPVEIEEALSHLALQPFDAAEFPFAFLAAFGNKDTALKRLRTGHNNTSDIPNGVLQRSNIHLAVCAAETVGDTLRALRASPATAKAKAKFALATDGQTLEAEDLNSGEILAVGTGRVLENGEVRALSVKVGDKVVFGPYSGSNTVKVDGEDLLVMSENEILAVIEG